MTVTYTDEIATAKALTLIKLLLFKWKGSILRLLWKELLVYLVVFYTIYFIYLWALNDDLKVYFEKIVENAKKYEDFKVFSMLLGFFVSTVMIRKYNST